MNFRFSLTAMALCVVHLSCSPTIIQVCSVGWTQFETEMIQAKDDLHAYAKANGHGDKMPLEQGGSRSLAGIRLSQEDQEHWQRWAQSQIKRSQKVMDLLQDSLLPESPRLRKALGQIADDLVEFDGYVGQGDLGKMDSTLQRAYGRGTALHREICSQLK